jgi:hypothetical protein
MSYAARAYTGPDIADIIRRSVTEVALVCETLGLFSDKGRPQRQAGGFLLRCPWPSHRDSTPSFSIQLKDGRIVWNCHGCKTGGTLLDLVAQREGYVMPKDTNVVARRCADLFHVQLPEKGASSELPPPQVSPVPAKALPLRDRTYPPVDEIATFWNQCIPVSDEPQAAAWLKLRGLNAHAVDDYQLARAIHRSAKLPRWARYKGDFNTAKTWLETGHIVVLPVFDEHGMMRSIRSCRVFESMNDGVPKRLPPSGYKAHGLIVADGLGQWLLKHGAPFEDRVTDVVFVEGEPDFLTRATLYPDNYPNPPAVFGVFSGSWSDALAARIPDGSDVSIRTHIDTQGKKYAAHLWETLAKRCTVRPLKGLLDDG